MFDRGFYKVLASNDTGAAPGHQGGIVVPKDLAPFFPPLPMQTSESQPTVDARLIAELFVDGRWVATVDTRYQHQTWGGKRSAERRLTDNLGPLRNAATADDILIFYRDLGDDRRIRLYLVTKGTPEFAALRGTIGSKRWGALDTRDPPVALEEIAEEEERIDARLNGAPEVFTTERPQNNISTRRRARDGVFRKWLLKAYDAKCTFSGQSFSDPRTEGAYGLDAAHIIPIHANGSDDPANGLLLCKDLHWAFDRGLMGVSEDRRIIVAQAARRLPNNSYLASFHGKPIREAVPDRIRAQDDALTWHRENILIGR